MQSSDKESTNLSDNTSQQLNNGSTNHTNGQEKSSQNRSIHQDIEVPIPTVDKSTENYLYAINYPSGQTSQAQKINIEPETQDFSPSEWKEPKTNFKKYAILSSDSPHRLRIINNCLLALLVLINVYIIVAPLIPQIMYSVNLSSDKDKQLEQTILQHQTGEHKVPNTPTNNISETQQTQDNSLIIPAMLLDEKIVEGEQSIKALRQGVWRWPGGSTPDKGGNTVLAGHRFTYNNPKGVFYFLNKLRKDDTIGVIWNSNAYTYKVTDIKTVKTAQTEILNPTKNSTLTLYTCTPLWNPKDRLVVVAELQTELN